jgi:hypothetical protein
MITTLDVKCPHCGQVSQIFLSTSVSVIILNCPSCFSPIMYFRRKIFLLDQQQLNKIAGPAARATEVFKLIEQLDGVKATAPCFAEKAAHFKENARQIVPAERFAIDRPEGKYITGDDCTNLRIELELCRDSQQFIDSIQTL